jgi:hypothetical protein
VNTVFGVLSVLGFVLAVGNLYRDRLAPRHREYQYYRREIDGFTLPWWLCWGYQFGIEHHLRPKAISASHQEWSQPAVDWEAVELLKSDPDEYFRRSQQRREKMDEWLRPGR